MLAGNLQFARPGLHPLLLDDALRHTAARLAGQVLLVCARTGGPGDPVARLLPRSAGCAATCE